MIDPEVEVHRSEIRRANRTTPLAVVTVLVIGLTGLLVVGSGGEPAPTPSTTVPPASAPQATRPGDPGATGSGEPPLIVGVAGDGARSRFVFRSHGAPLQPLDDGAGPRLVESAVVTVEQTALVDTDGQVSVATADGAVTALICCHQLIAPSYRPGSVWGFDPGGTAVLVDLEDGRTAQEIDLDGEPVIGPGPGGLVTFRAGDGRAVWRRPHAGPVVVDTRAGRRPVSSGGAVIAYVVGDGGVVEVRRIVDGLLVRSFSVPGARPGSAVRLSTSGDALAVHDGRSVLVHRISDGRLIGQLPGRAERPVPVGDGRFAAAVGDEVVSSDGRRLVFDAEPELVAVRAE